MMDRIFENVEIDKIAKNFQKAPHKIGHTHEADAEIIDLGVGCQNHLAITTDALVEEVRSGLYENPYFMGWMLAMVNFSDLAAVGADPLGLLLSISYSPNGNEKFITKLARGVSDACQELNTFVLGGDTNQGEDLLLSGCAVGLVPKQSALTRMGAKVNDRLYISYPAGLGNVFAFLKLSKMNFLIPSSFYKPIARIKEGRVIRDYANCCMMITRIKKIPSWLVLAGIHGEYELVFTVSPQKEKNFLDAAARIGWTPLLIGEVCEGEGVNIQNSDTLKPLDTAAIRNLSEQAGSDPQAYVKKLIQMAKESGIH